jgi:hypothetical protein
MKQTRCTHCGEVKETFKVKGPGNERACRKCMRSFSKLGRLVQKKYGISDPIKINEKVREEYVNKNIEEE